MNKPLLEDKKAVIFDMDGVLIDSEHWWRKVEDKFYVRLLDRWTDADEDRIIGMSLKDIHALLIKEYGLSMDFQKFVDEYTHLARVIYETQVKLLPGTRETLEHFKKSPFKTALASSSLRSWIRMVVKRFDLSDYFDIIVSAEEVGDSGKPAPDIYFYTAKQLGVLPKECLVIEDSKNGVLSAHAAGMSVIGLQTFMNHDQDLSAADGIIENVKEMISV